jgi:hypothetical protein
MEHFCDTSLPSPIVFCRLSQAFIKQLEVALVRLALIYFKNHELVITYEIITKPEIAT